MGARSLPCDLRCPGDPGLQDPPRRFSRERGSVDSTGRDRSLGACYALITYPPSPKFIRGKPQPAGPQNMTVFGNRVFKEVTELKRGRQGGH